MERKAKAATETGVFVAIVAAILVVVNVIAYVGLRKRFDFTRNERYTLSAGSARLVASLKSPIKVDAYVTKGLPKLDAFVRDLNDLLRLYQNLGGGKFNYAIVEAKSEEQRKEAKELGLRDVAFGESSETGEDQASIAQGYMGLVFKYGSEKEVIPIMSPDRSDGLEFWITNKIRELRDKADGIQHKIGFITGHDEIKLTETHLIPSQGRGGGPSMKGIIDQAFPFYKIEDVDLKGGDAEINQEFDGIIITQPGKDFTDKELRRIDQFLMLGNKALAVFASAVNLKASDPSMKATIATHGLEKLLDGYGIEMKKDAVLEWARPVRVPIMTQVGLPAWIRYPPILQAQRDSRLDDKSQILDDRFAAFFRAEEISIPYPSSLVLHAEKQPEARIKEVVARTTPAAWSETGDSIDLKIAPNWRPKPPTDHKNVGIHIQGTLKAALGSGDGVEVPATSKAESRIFVLSSAQFLTNPFARAGAGMDLGGQFAMMGPVGGDETLQMISQPYAQKYLTGTILALKNTLDWLSGDADLIAASAKIFGDPNLTYADITRPKIDANDDDATVKKKDEEFRDARKNSQRRIQWTLTLLCPALFAAYGILRWRKREGDRAAITLD